MARFGKFLKEQRTKMNLNQSDFGHHLGIIMTDISKIENNRKRFPFANLEKLAKLLNMDYSEIKNLYVADILVCEAHKYNCDDTVFSIAEKQSKYLKSKNIKQGKIKF
jgi:transcriptional regulator with XRE-family HTH domain